MLVYFYEIEILYTFIKHEEVLNFRYLLIFGYPHNRYVDKFNCHMFINICPLFNPNSASQDRTK